MKLYTASGNKDFKVVELENNPAEEQVKLKVGMVYPTLADVSVYEGKLDIEYPRVPCRMATAVVSEDRPEYGLKLGSRVILNPYVNPNESEDED